MTFISLHFFYLSSKRKEIIYVIIVLLRNKINLNFVLRVGVNVCSKLSTFYAGKSHEDFEFSQDESFTLKLVKCSKMSESIIYHGKTYCTWQSEFFDTVLLSHSP